MLPPLFGGIGRAQGYGAASVWKQRAWRWTLSALRITGKSWFSFLTYDAGGFFPNLAFRLYRFREYKIITVQLLYLPFALVVCLRGFVLEFVLLKIALMMVPLTRNIIINYIIWHGQPELQVSLETVLLSPFYNMFLMACAIHGRWMCLLWYVPTTPPNHGMLQRLRPVDPNEMELSPDLLGLPDQGLRNRIITLRRETKDAQSKKDQDEENERPVELKEQDIKDLSDYAETGEAGVLMNLYPSYEIKKSSSSAMSSVVDAIFLAESLDEQELGSSSKGEQVGFPYSAKKAQVQKAEFLDKLARLDSESSISGIEPYVPRRVQHYLYSRWNSFELCRKDATSIIVPYVSKDEWLRKKKMMTERGVRNEDEADSDEGAEGSETESIHKSKSRSDDSSGGLSSIYDRVVDMSSMSYSKEGSYRYVSIEASLKAKQGLAAFGSSLDNDDFL
jgi:hypothetical protein